MYSQKDSFLCVPVYVCFPSEYISPFLDYATRLMQVHRKSSVVSRVQNNEINL